MKKLVFALSILGLTSMPAFAAMDFATVDADSDGQVTLDEAKAAGIEWTEDQFAAADVDKSGGLSEAEFKVAMG